MKIVLDKNIFHFLMYTRQLNKIVKVQCRCLKKKKIVSYLFIKGRKCRYIVKCSFQKAVVERPLMVRWVVGSIPHGGPSELFLVTGVIYCLWDGAHKRTLIANRKE